MGQEHGALGMAGANWTICAAAASAGMCRQAVADVEERLVLGERRQLQGPGLPVERPLAWLNSSRISEAELRRTRTRRN
jgi:hypothetical protein